MSRTASRTRTSAADYAVVDLGTLAETDVRVGYPTPTLLYARRDLFGMTEPSMPNPPAG